MRRPFPGLNSPSNSRNIRGLGESVGFHKVLQGQEMYLKPRYGRGNQYQNGGGYRLFGFSLREDGEKSSVGHVEPPKARQLILERVMNSANRKVCCIANSFAL